MKEATLVDHDTRVIHVCAWCHPEQTIYKHYPHLRDLGYKLSHGICEGCKAKLMEMPCETLKPLSYFIRKYGADFIRKLPFYATAKHGDAHVEMMDVNVSMLRAQVKRAGGEVFECDVRELDNFVL